MAGDTFPPSVGSFPPAWGRCRAAAPCPRSSRTRWCSPGWSSQWPWPGPRPACDQGSILCIDCELECLAQNTNIKCIIFSPASQCSPGHLTWSCWDPWGSKDPQGSPGTGTRWTWIRIVMKNKWRIISLHLFPPDGLCGAHSESQLHVLGRDLRRKNRYFNFGQINTVYCKGESALRLRYIQSTFCV